jgi:hypothetical protein
MFSVRGNWAVLPLSFYAKRKRRKEKARLNAGGAVFLLSVSKIILHTKNLLISKIFIIYLQTSSVGAHMQRRVGSPALASVLALNICLFNPGTCFVFHSSLARIVEDNVLVEEFNGDMVLRILNENHDIYELFLFD